MRRRSALASVSARTPSAHAMAAQIRITVRNCESAMPGQYRECARLTSAWRAQPRAVQMARQLVERAQLSEPAWTSYS